ncbi:MAG: Gfo/Idh/MocA family oxidoreductase [Candidatus Omnitrophica bacterium]|nr:Gfo/Idh/MocA family oxidoreductase [Candidatus Omnitrophota bacterium]
MVHIKTMIPSTKSRHSYFVCKEKVKGMGKIRIGIIGCGVIGQVHIRPAIESGLYDVVAVAHTISENAKKVSQEFNIKKFYSDGELCAAKRLKIGLVDY